MLTKTQSVLDRKILYIDSILFTPDPEQMETEFPAVHLPREVYEDMGRPEAITVTVVPGDLLNGD